ncbi:MAG: Tm-1-like ATP-binding domain-containing protein, partial [Candidatus Bathyarchaeia archaeon]
MDKTVLIIATLDTKGEEVGYIKERLEVKGKRVLVMDSGTRGAPIGVKADIPREEVAKAAGHDIREIGEMRRGPAIEAMKKGIAKICKELYESGRIHGIMSVGGSDGACLASAGMQVLPVGVPKLLISPVFQGKETFGEFVGTKDVICMHSMIDILGINQFSRK